MIVSGEHMGGGELAMCAVGVSSGPAGLLGAWLTVAPQTDVNGPSGPKPAFEKNMRFERPL